MRSFRTNLILSVDLFRTLARALDEGKEIYTANKYC